jgi:NAD(P)-dependent dehydrogenase (short-subunit alcohol dehydrogenase family)
MAERRVALVTGGGRGIGLGIARALAREGCDLAICGTRPAAAVAEAVRELEGLGAAVQYVQADIASRDDRARLVGAVRERYGRLHVLVNNAGMAPRVRADILEASEESYEEVMRTNLQGPYFLTQAVARWMVEERRADPAAPLCIVNISSISATVASTNRGEYCLSKAGVSMATRLWAVRLAEFGIPVYEVRPGIIDTDMTAGVRARYDALIAGGLLLQARWGLPEDVGRAVAMLVRGDLGYSTGQVIWVDGGMSVPRL